MLNKASENYEEAKKVLTFMTSPEYELAHLRLANQPPARVDVLETAAADPAFADFSELLANLNQYHQNSIMRGRPMLPATMEYITVTGTLFQQYILDEITLDELGQKQLEAYEEMK